MLIRLLKLIGGYRLLSYCLGIVPFAVDSKVLWSEVIGSALLEGIQSRGRLEGNL